MIASLARVLPVYLTVAIALASAIFSPADGAPIHPEHAALERLERTLDALYEQARIAAGSDDSNSRGDVAGAISDCRYLGQFQYLEMLDYERIEADRERCASTVSTRYPDHPEVVLYRLEQLNGQALIGEAEALLERGQAVGWTNRQAANLYELLAYAYAEQDLDKAGYYANAAMNLDLFSPVREMAVRWLIDRGRTVLAEKVLTAPRLAPTLDPAGEIALLFELGADDLAIARYAALNEDDGPGHDELSLARQLLRYGQDTLADEQYDAAANAQADWYPEFTASVLYERFRVALNRDDRTAAVSTYDRLREGSWKNDPLLRLRLMLGRAYPDVPITWRELPGALAVLGVVLGALLLPWLTLIAPVHYRGLMRQHAAKPRRPTPFAWRLEHAWLALSLALVLNLGAAYLLHPSAWSPGLPDGDSPVLESAGDLAVAHLTVASLSANALTAVLLLPFCGGMAGLRRLLSSRWDWRQTLTVVLLSWLGLRVLAMLLIGTFGLHGAGAAVIAQLSELQTEIFATIETLGLLPSVALMGLVAPISEELLFRGVLLSAFARHLSFAFANLLQASLFALIHGELVLAPFFLGLGLVAGWTVKRSGGLRAAILLHMVNNLVAVVLRVALTSLGGDS
ncbi:MAG: type II CAAX endopeptidase family protein [Pseudomonadota bacterium]